jgi:hypothetical protein
MALARRSISPAIQPEPAPRDRVSGYTLLSRLPGSLRCDVWLALPDGDHALDQVVQIDLFVPHAPGSVLDNLVNELRLAAQLQHDNIVRTSHVGFESGRHFAVREHLEGVTLQALLRSLSVTGARMPEAAVVRVLLGIIAAVDHAERWGQSVGASRLGRQLVAAEDVFITHDGAVKLLGLEASLAAAVGSGIGRAAPALPAIDALLAEHLTTELAAVLSVASRSGVQRRDRLRHVGQGLQRWQSEHLGSDGRRELARVMSACPNSARFASRMRLEAAFEDAQRAGRVTGRIAIDDRQESAPVSGFRRIEVAVARPSAPAELRVLRCSPRQPGRSRAAIAGVCLSLGLVLYAIFQGVAP